MSRGIPEVPLLPNLDPQVRRYLQDLRQVVVRLQEAQAPLASPTNLKVTPEAFGNLIQWTRSAGSDFTEVLWNTTPTVINSVVVNVGNSAQWTDNVGKDGIKRYYWVRARKNSGTRSLETGPIAGTTLASGTAVAPPTPPPPAQNQFLDQRTGGRTFQDRNTQ